MSSTTPDTLLVLAFFVLFLSGIAAVGVGGCTIHSFAGIGPGRDVGACLPGTDMEFGLRVHIVLLLLTVPSRYFVFRHASVALPDRKAQTRSNGGCCSDLFDDVYGYLFNMTIVIVIVAAVFVVVDVVVFRCLSTITNVPNKRVITKQM